MLSCARRRTLLKATENLTIKANSERGQMRLGGKKAVLTGAAGALGRVIAGTLAAEGAWVAGIGHNQEGLEETARQWKAKGRGRSR